MMDRMVAAAQALYSSAEYMRPDLQDAAPSAAVHTVVAVEHMWMDHMAVAQELNSPVEHMAHGYLVFALDYAVRKAAIA
jgi:hypothetical protein